MLIDKDEVEQPTSDNMTIPIPYTEYIDDVKKYGIKFCIKCFFCVGVADIILKSQIGPRGVEICSTMIDKVKNTHKMMEIS